MHLRPLSGLFRSGRSGRWNPFAEATGTFAEAKDPAATIERYKRLRRAGLELNNELASCIGREDLIATAKKLGCWHRGSLVLDDASSAESVGEFGLRELPKCVVDGDFRHFQLPVAVGFSDRQFDLVVQPLHDPAVELLFR